MNEQPPEFGLPMFGLPMITSLAELQAAIAKQKSYGSLTQFLRSRENMVHKSKWWTPVNDEEGKLIDVTEHSHTYAIGKNHFKRMARSIQQRFGLTLSQAKKVLLVIHAKQDEEKQHEQLS